MAETSQQPFEVSDFSAGITDDIYNQQYNTGSEMDNFTITSDKKILSRPGSVVDDTTVGNDQIPGGVTRVATMINYANSANLLVHSLVDFYYRNPSAYTTIVGPTGNPVLSVGAITNALSYAQWKSHVFVTNDGFPRPMKIFKDNLGVLQVRNSGLPGLATDPVVTVGAAGANNFIYAFHYVYDYQVGDETFETLGKVTFVSLPLSDDPSINPNSITAIPAISNGATDNYDTANIKVFIYRTINNGDTFFKVGEVTNGTAIFSDNTSDTVLIDNLELYTDSGEVDWDEAPLSKFVHVVNGIGYYGWIKDSGGEFPFRIIQSIPGAPGSVSNSFLKDAEDEIRGISSVKSIPIILCNKLIYRVESSVDQFGRGDYQLVRISDHAGCVSQLSCVQAEGGLFWAGNDGFYYTDGYQVQKISDNNNTRYKAILAAQSQQNRIYGKFDETERRIYWAIEKDSGNLDNDSLIVLDLRWGITNNSSFTTWSGNSFRPTSLEYFNGQLYRGDTRGYVFIHDVAYTADPKVDTTKDAVDWITETIIWLYSTININFGSTFFRKMPVRFLLTAGNLANTTIQISAINDATRIERPMKIIRWRKNFVWGDPDFVWENPDCVWSGTGLIENWRRFPAKGLRLSYVQINITNGFGVISNSNTIGTAYVDPAAKTFTLDIATNKYPDVIEDYYFSTSFDNYSKQYKIVTRNSDTVATVLDPDGTLPLGSFPWLISGQARNEPLWLLSYNIFWNNVSQTQATFETGQDGAN